MKKEVMVREQAALPTAPAPAPVSDTEFLTSDMIIPRVLLMQGLSKIVAERKAVMGDMVRSTNCEKLGDDRTPPIKFIPLTYKLTWQNSEKINGKFEYRGSEPRNAQNEGLPYGYFKDGSEWIRVKCVELFALLSKDIDADVAPLADGELPDLNKVLLPVLISFRGKSYPAGKVIIDHFMRVKTMQRKLPTIQPFMYELELSCEADSNDKGNFFIYKIPVNAKKAPDTHIAAATEWAKIVSTQNVRVDEEVKEAEVSSSMGSSDEY